MEMLTHTKSCRTNYLVPYEKSLRPLAGIGEKCLALSLSVLIQHNSGAKLIKICLRVYTNRIIFMFFYLLLHRETKRKGKETGRENSDFQGFCGLIRKKTNKNYQESDTNHPCAAIVERFVQIFVLTHLLHLNEKQRVHVDVPSEYL